MCTMLRARWHGQLGPGEVLVVPSNVYRSRKVMGRVLFVPNVWSRPGNVLTVGGADSMLNRIIHLLYPRQSQMH